MPMVLDDDLLYPETPYLFSVLTAGGYVHIAVDETQWDIPAPFEVKDFGSSLARMLVQLHFEKHGIDMRGKPIALDDAQIAPESIFNTLGRQDQDNAYIASFELLYGTQPDALPDAYVIPETGDGAEERSPAAPLFESADFEPWIGFDLDGTLAVRVSDDETAAGLIGEPIWPIVNLLFGHLEDGDMVKIFTARAADKEQIPHVKAWLEALDLGNLEVTNIKDPGMIKLYDDRAVSVISDTGVLGAVYEEAAIRTPLTIQENLQRGREAMKRVLSRHVNEPRAMYRKDLGWIAFFWGKPGGPPPKCKGGYGISKIIAKRDWEGENDPQLAGQSGKSVAMQMVEVIAHAAGPKRTQGDGKSRRIELQYGGYSALLSMFLFEDEKVWLMTGWKIKDLESDGPGEVYDSAGPTTDEAIRFQLIGGADFEAYGDNVTNPDGHVKIILEAAVNFKQKRFTLADRYQFQGMPISIENKAGQVRRGVDPDGHKWETKMHFNYGYIRRTEGEDGEGIDVYVGKDRTAKHAYIVKQHKIEAVKAWGSEYCPDCNEHVHDCGCKKYYDEDKVFIGFPSKKAAIEAYLKQYDSPLFLGPVSTMTVESFRDLVTGPGKKVQIPLQLVAESAAGEWDLKPGVVAYLSAKTAAEINKLGFDTTAGAVVVSSMSIKHINQSHGKQLSDADMEFLRLAIENPDEILPNIGMPLKEHRSKSVLLVSRSYRDYIAIVEITPGEGDNLLWNFWKMRSSTSNRYLARFRAQKKAHIVAESGGRPTDPHIPHNMAKAKVGKPEGLSGSQSQQLGLFNDSIGNADVKAFFESAGDWRARIRNARFLCDVKTTIRDALDLQDIQPTSVDQIKALDRFFSRLNMRKHEYDLPMKYPDGRKVVQTVSGWRLSVGDIFATHKDTSGYDYRADKEIVSWVVTHLQTGGKVREFTTKIKAAEFMWRATQLGKDIWDFDSFETMPKELSGQMMKIIKDMSAGTIPYELIDQLIIGD